MIQRSAASFSYSGRRARAAVQRIQVKFSFGECTRSSGRPKPTSSVSNPRIDLIKPTTGMLPPSRMNVGCDAEADLQRLGGEFRRRCCRSAPAPAPTAPCHLNSIFTFSGSRSLQCFFERRLNLLPDPDSAPAASKPSPRLGGDDRFCTGALIAGGDAVDVARGPGPFPFERGITLLAGAVGNADAGCEFVLVERQLLPRLSFFWRQRNDIIVESGKIHPAVGIVQRRDNSHSTFAGFGTAPPYKPLCRS